MKSALPGLAAGAVLVALSAIALVSLNHGDVAPPTGEPASSVKTSPATGAVSPDLRWADGVPVDASTLDLSSAEPAVEGADYTILYTTPQAYLGEPTLGALALTAGGALVAVQVPAGQYDGGQWLLKPTAVGMFDGQAFVPFAPDPEVPGASDHPRQAYGGAADAGTVVWAETESTDLYFSNWRVFSRDQSGTVHLVAHSEEVYPGVLPLLDGDSRPVVSGDRVYWATAAPIGDSVAVDGTGAFRMDVMSRATDGSGPIRVEATGATNPAAGGGALFVVRHTRADPTLDQGESRLERVDGDSQTSLVVRQADRSTFKALVTDGQHVAFVVGDGTREGAIYVLDTSTRSALRIPLGASGASTSLAMCPDRLVWTSADAMGSGQTVPFSVLDLNTTSLHSIDVPDAFSGAHCAGDLIGWATIEPDPTAAYRTTIAHWDPAP